MGVNYYLKIPEAKIAFSLGKSNLFGEPDREIKYLEESIEQGIRSSEELWEEEFEDKSLDEITIHDFTKLVEVFESFESIFDIQWRQVLLVYLVDKFYELDWEIVSEFDYSPREELENGWRTISLWRDVIVGER